MFMWICHFEYVFRDISELWEQESRPPGLAGSSARLLWPKESFSLYEHRVFLERVKPSLSLAATRRDATQRRS